MIRDDDDYMENRRKSMISIRRASEAIPRTITIDGGPGASPGSAMDGSRRHGQDSPHSRRNTYSYGNHSMPIDPPALTSPQRSRERLSLSKMLSPDSRRRKSTINRSILSAVMGTPTTAASSGDEGKRNQVPHLHNPLTSPSMQSPIKRMSNIIRKSMVWRSPRDGEADGDDDDNDNDNDGAADYNHQHNQRLNHHNSSGMCHYEDDSEEDGDADSDGSSFVPHDDYISPKSRNDAKGIEEKELTLVLLCRELELISD